MNIKLILILIFLPTIFFISHEVNIEDKSVEEIVKKEWEI